MCGQKREGIHEIKEAGNALLSNGNPSVIPYDTIRFRIRIQDCGHNTFYNCSNNRHKFKAAVGKNGYVCVRVDLQMAKFWP